MQEKETKSKYSHMTSDDRVKIESGLNCKLPYKEIAENDYNLSVSTYVEAEDTREKIDIVKLNEEIAQIVAREEVLRAEIDKIIAEIEV